MDSNLEEISERLHGFCRKFVAADARFLIPLSKQNPIGRLKQTNYSKPGGGKLQNPLGF